MIKYPKRPCNTDCDHYITKPELCKKCLEESFTFETEILIKEDNNN